MYKLSTIVTIVLLGVSLATLSQERILFITSNQNTYGNTKLKTANHFGEIVLAYDVFIKNGFKIDFVSPNGGTIPIGYIKTENPIQKKYIENLQFLNYLKNTLKPKDINPKNYVAVYYSGGGAAMFGVPENKKIRKITESIYNNNGFISAVCHGTAGIVNLKDKTGSPLYKERKITGYPDKFEKQHKPYYKTFPFSIEQKISQQGGNFSYSEKGWNNHFIVDERFVTGQDPTSSESVAEKVVELIKKAKKSINTHNYEKFNFNLNFNHLYISEFF